MQRMFMWSFAVAVALTGSAGCRQITDLDSLEFSGVGGAGGATVSSGMGGSGGGGEGGGTGGAGGGAIDACGDGAVEDPEKCDDGNKNPGDGCNNCEVELGFVCFGSPNQCYRGNTNAVTGRCFFIHPIKMKWGSASQGCKDYGGTLARIFDINDQNTVGYISRLEDIYLGASDTVLEGTFTWVTGEPLTFTAWKNLQPDDYMGEDCVVMQISDEWNDVNCDASKPFLCELDSCQ